MVQLWINLPKEFKMTSPKYQSIKKREIPCIKLNNEINIRLIAGDYKNKLGPAKTFTKIKNNGTLRQKEILYNIRS